MSWRVKAVLASLLAVSVVAASVAVAVLVEKPVSGGSRVSASSRPPATSAPVALSTRSVTPSTVPRSRLTAIPSPSVAPTAASCSGLGCPDGKPGWSSGYASCSPATGAAGSPGDPPVQGMVLTLALPSSVASGTDAHGTLTVTNHSSVTVSFELRQPRIGLEAGVVGQGGRSSVHASDALGSEAFELGPGESDSVNVVAHTSSCGDGAADKEEPLPPGAYQVGVTVGYVNAERRDGATTGPEVRPHGSWSVAQPLRIT